MNNIYDFKLNSINGKTIDFSEFEGKVILIVNVASQCEYTPQYEKLQELYDKYTHEGFEIIGVPCNQFWKQEPGTHHEIMAYCQSNYSITFPLTEKLEVNGDNMTPLYEFLTNVSSGKPGDISWNFEKFLIDKSGQIIDRYAPEMSPDDSTIQKSIEKCLFV